MDVVTSQTFSEIFYSGIAQGPGYDTREWLAKHAEATTRATRREDLISALMEDSSDYLAAVRSGQVTAGITVDTRLTILICSAEANAASSTRNLWIDFLSSFETIGGKTKIATSLERLSFRATRPQVITLGQRGAVSKENRAKLEAMLRLKPGVDAIRALLSDMVKTAHDQHPQLVSASCTVHRLAANGEYGSSNLSGAPGIPHAFMSGMDLRKVMLKRLTSLDGSPMLFKHEKPK